MKKLLLFLLIFFASSASAQVAVTVTAEMGGSYAGGSITASNVTPGGTGTPALAFFFNSSGTVSAGLPSNGTWQFTFCNTSNVCFVAQISLSGLLTFDATTIFTAAANVGGTATNGTGGSISPAQPVMAITIAPSCPSGNTGNCINAYGNTQQDDAATFNSTTTVAITHGSFCDAGATPCTGGKTTSVGMVELGTGSCFNNVAGSGVVVPAGTIVSVTNSTHAVVSIIANSSTTGCFTWGNDDSAAFASADTASQAATNTSCPAILIASGNYILRAERFALQPPPCSLLPSVVTGSNPAGFGWAIGGSGMGATRIFFIPTTTFNTSIFGSSATIGMWLHDFTLDCAGDETASWATSNNINGLVHMGPYTKLTNVNLGACAAANSNTIGVGFEVNAHLSYVTVDTFGGTSAQNSTNPGGMTVDHSTFQDSLSSYAGETTGYTASQLVLTAGGSIHSVGGNTFAAPQSSISTCLVCQIGSATTANFNQDSLFDNGDTGLVMPVYQSTAATSSFLRLDRTGISHANASAASGDVICNGYCMAVNSTFNAATSGTAAVILVNSGANFADLGGNVMNLHGTSPAVTNNGVFSGSASIVGTALATGNVAISACGTSAAGSFSGGSQAGQYTVTFAGTPVTTCTSTVTFPTPFWVAPLCSVVSNGGNNPAFPSNITVSSVSNTALVFTENFAAVWTAGDTTIVSL